MGINIFGRLFTINIGRVTTAINTPEITLDNTGLSIWAPTWIGGLRSPDSGYNYFCFCVLGFGIGVQVREKGKEHV